MIGKLLRGLSWLLVYTCLATVISEFLLTAYFGRAWGLDRTKLVQMLAIAQGVDLAALREQAHGNREEPSSEQASYSQVLEARAMKSRNLELREQALRSGMLLVQSEQRQLVEAKKQFQTVQEKFAHEVAALEKGAVAAGRDDARRTAGGHEAQTSQRVAVANAGSEGN